MFSRNKFYDVVKIRDHKSQKQRILDVIDTREEHTFENIINLVMKYPILLERPIVSIERNKKIIQSIICRPTELIKSVFS